MPQSGSPTAITICRPAKGMEWGADVPAYYMSRGLLLMHGLVPYGGLSSNSVR